MPYTMINLNIILPILVLGLASLILFIVTCVLCLRKEKYLQKKSTIFNTFPCELNSLLTEKRRVHAVYSFFLFLLFYVGGSLIYTFNLLTTLGEFNWLGLVIVIVIFIESIMYGLNFGFSLYYPNKHIIFTTLSFASTILKNGLLATYGFYNSHVMRDYSQFSISFGTAIAYSVLALLLVILLLNPKLSSWAKKNKTEQDGATYFLRPKVNFLALTEWIYIASLGITLILLIVDTSLGYMFL